MKIGLSFFLNVLWRDFTPCFSLYTDKGISQCMSSLSIVYSLKNNVRELLTCVLYSMFEQTGWINQLEKESKMKIKIEKIK